MTIVVDHKERRQQIMSKTLRLIGERGYGDVTYQQIADICGLSRTTLYKYFKNKREIFDFAILELVESIGKDFNEAVKMRSYLSSSDKIRMLYENVIDIMYKDPPLIQAIIEYLIGLRRRGEPVMKRIRRHTIGMHRLLTRLFREGMESGEFRTMDCNCAAEMIYALIETATMRLTLMETFDRKLFATFIDAILEGIIQPEWRRQS
ncbi:MAG: TetR/AcrR family transcriptional regulator [Victivallales bacterium]|nr:TetR/AcrR family transcriptional regulator [Victivallales bacterium]